MTKSLRKKKLLRLKIEKKGHQGCIYFLNQSNWLIKRSSVTQITLCASFGAWLVKDSKKNHEIFYYDTKTTQKEVANKKS